ncbi:Glucose receptor Git3, N-terminal [Penicillium italicum]|uniref:Glucose receptor Git3, N-terminal n=1 Tax=Penicillium italicum TaxID=40296 RepID=A0A0A2LGU7_PENIT|nr:Glucose receptor Git3, N-terminal [Penicillium italicum]
MTLSEQQILAISATERVCSTISLVGTFVIVATFIWSPTFRKPINRLVFYASWGNIMANIATIISADGIHSGVDSSLCQFQGFLIQWFMPADALWTFAMACNVYLTFFHKYDSEQLRRLEWKYVLCCYGVPFVPAFAYFFIQTQARGRIYGSAILWCWISVQWSFLRIAIFYGPVWLIISLTFAIYLRAGTVIYQKRRQLRNLGGIDSDLVPESPFALLTGIQVTREIACSTPERRSLSEGATRGLPSNTFRAYSVTIEGGNTASTTQDPSSNVGPSPLRQENSSKAVRPDGADSQRRSTSTEASSATWAYTKYAMLFFIALLVTWPRILVAYTPVRPTPQIQIPKEPQIAPYKLLSPYPHALDCFPLSDPIPTADTSTMAESNSHQPPAASPSPPPPAPIPQSPGPRASRLNQVFEQALARTLRANSYANFAGCFPTPARHVPASLEGVWRQLNAKLEANAKAEFDDIVAERDAVAHLNELDRLVGDAKARREQEGENAEGQERTVAHTLGAEDLYKAHLTPYLQEAQSTLNARLEATHAENAELAQTVQAQRLEIERLLSHLGLVVSDIEGAATAATQFSRQHHIRQDAIQMDEEAKARPGL